MFGSKILEVAIGLIFVFMLYSLFASAIQELISTIFVLRARMLRQAIKKMLMDRNSFAQRARGKGIFYRIYLRLKDFICFFLHPFLPKLKEEQTLLNMFYEQPGIKYLAVSNWYKRPSFIKPESFAKTLTDILIDNGKGTNDADKITHALETNLLNFNGSEMSVDPETLVYLKSLWRDAKQEPERFKTVIIAWYNETMDRLKSMYKRHMRFYLFVIGYLIALTFNVDIISLSNTLSKDDKVRSDLVQLASSYMQTHTIDSVRVKAISDSSVKPDSISREIKSLFRSMKRDLNAPNNLIAIGWSVPSNFKRNILADSLDSLNTFNKGITDLVNSEHARNRFPQHRISVCDECINKIYAKHKKCAKEKQRKPEPNLSIWNKLSYLWCMATNTRSLLGYLITAIGISLGAPFWYELLQKVIKLKDAMKTKNGEAK
jgi:hypothetical protein